MDFSRDAKLNCSTVQMVVSHLAFAYHGLWIYFILVSCGIHNLRYDEMKCFVSDKTNGDKKHK